MDTYHYHYYAEANTRMKTLSFDGIYTTSYPIPKMDGYTILKNFIRQRAEPSLPDDQEVMVHSLTLLRIDEDRE